MDTKMMCRQCEQTAQGTGCSVHGVCGKDPESALLQDLLVYVLCGIAVYGQKARELQVKCDALETFIAEGLFSTITNVNFDPARIQELILKACKYRDTIKNTFLEAYKAQNGKDFADSLPAAADFTVAASREAMLEAARNISLIARPGINEDIQSLREVLLYGIKGMAAYDDHAHVLGYSDDTVRSFYFKGLAALVDDSLTVDQLVALVMEFGQVNLKCMEMLDTAHTTTFGHPEPTQVSLGVKKGPAIVVSGHDLQDLKQLLDQTKGSGINIYTHGEMLPAHAYPELKKYDNLVGHYGTAWQNQQKEFAEFPGAILMTTNCIQKPQDIYQKNIFTTGLVAWPGLMHIDADQNGKKDFKAVIKRAKELQGFNDDQEGKEITIGFAHHTVLGVADAVIEAVKSGAIKHFFLIGGCDGAKPGRNYYTELAEKVPNDSIILTLACGKFRFNTLDFGSIGGIPRLLDCGQCNDAYSAIKIASALAEAFKCTVNDLPLTLILSWYEQKAVCILLTLLSLGIKNIKLGPTLPAFITPNVLKVLVDNFNIGPITTPEADIKAALETV
jgi:hydroxylamine reductase